MFLKQTVTTINKIGSAVHGLSKVPHMPVNVMFCAVEPVLIQGQCVIFCHNTGSICLPSTLL